MADEARPYEQIDYEVEGPVLTITLDRPDKMNAFTPTMFRELLDAFDRADADDDVRAVIVTGRGRAFCAGADLSMGAKTFDDAAHAAGASGGPKAPRDVAAHRDEGGRLTLRIFQCTKPVIAAINGPAVGIGITMTLAMDVRLAADDAKMGFVFARRGIVPEAASSWFLPRLVGISQALEWCYSGRVFPAAEALEGRLVRSLHPVEEVVPAARALALEIAENTSALSVALTRQMMWRMLGAEHPMEAHKIDSRAINAMGRTADAAEGVTSFLEKRPPRFPGRVSADLPEFYPWWSEPAYE
ncbi:MAG: crotonase/enoyl-CoA hydratase family protein [Acidimicrobiales bacterium]|nr:crotonase/enoyl-CoA hydratase family protein [Acidimicrobiales bacterium]